MSKKLVSIVLVLALASVSSAATLNWTGPVQPNAAGEWNAANWGGTATTVADLCRLWTSSAQDASAIVTTSGVAKSGKLQAHGPGGTSKLTVASGADLQVDGSYEAYNYASTMDVIGTVNAATKTATTLADFKLGGKGLTSTVNVWGSLIVTSYRQHVGISSLKMGHTYTAGGGVLNIMDGGKVYADAITFSGTTNDINLYGDARLFVAGDQTLALPFSTRFSGDGTVGNVVATYDAGTDTTIVSVPEPATVALLGIGSLMLLRRKR